jgi:hypothetical protein
MNMRIVLYGSNIPLSHYLWRTITLISKYDTK